MKAERHTGVELGEAFTKANTIFMRLQRRITAAEKSHKEAMAELKRLQQASQPQETKPETQQMASLLPIPLTEGHRRPPNRPTRPLRERGLGRRPRERSELAPIPERH